MEQPLASDPARPRDPALPPVDERWFEDYHVGSVHECGSVTVGEAEIVEFAERFDPQPFHVDAAGAAAGPFGGLIASGWHTAGLAVRLLVDHYVSAVSSLGGSGTDDLRRPRPVRPGDALSLTATVELARRSRSAPDRGVVRTRTDLTDQHGELVYTAVLTHFLRCRLPSGPDAGTVGE